jgi:hypothetical protein
MADIVLHRSPSVARAPKGVLVSIIQGSYVTHAKLPELGSGEILSIDNGRIGIRFASGQRNFMYDLVAPHLTVTNEAPARPPAKSGKRAKAAATKT